MKIGGPVKYVKDKETSCLTKDQARYMYEKVELEYCVDFSYCWFNLEV